MVFGGAIVGIWYWCTDQYIVQRTLAAQNIEIGRRGAIFGAYLKILPVFIFLIPGIIAFALKEKGVLTYERADQVFPVLVQTLLPAGFRGLVAGGLMAALMSSLASVFNSSSTLFTMDIFKKIYPDSSEKKLVRIGQVATAIVVVLGMAWIPIMEKIGGGTLYRYLQSVQSYIAPPITTVFLLGILWKRINAKGAISTLFFGLLMAVIRIIAELTYLDNNGKLIEGASGMLATYADINFAHMSIFMFIACVFVCIGVSLATAPPAESKIRGLTFGTLTSEQKATAKNSYAVLDIVASLLLVAVIVGILFYFQG
jgi:SSS family solute:Na+ symporter